MNYYARKHWWQAIKPSNIKIFGSLQVNHPRIFILLDVKKFNILIYLNKSKLIDLLCCIKIGMIECSFSFIMWDISYLISNKLRLMLD